MMTRPFVILLAGALLSSTAHADRRHRNNDRDDDQEEENEPTKDAKRSIGGEERRRAAKAVQENRIPDDDDDADREEAPKKKTKKHKTAQVELSEEDNESEGIEAKAAVGIKLDDVIEATIRRSPHLARQKLEREAAKGDAGASRLPQAWTVEAEAKYDQYGVGGDADVEVFDVVKQEKIDGSLSIGRKTPIGGSVKATVDFNRTSKELAISKEVLNNINGDDKAPATGIDEFATTHNVFASLSFTQPLLRGIGSDVALADQHKADLRFSEQTLATQYEAEKTIFEIIKLYWETAAANFELDVRKQSLDLAVKQEKFTRDTIRVGAAGPTSLNAITYEIAQRDEARLRAQIDLERKSLELRKKSGLQLSDRSIVVRPSQSFELGNETFDMADELAKSRKSNRRAVILALKRREADIDVKVTDNAMLPRADLALTAGIMGKGDSTDEAFSNAAGQAGYQVTATLTLQFEISGAARDAHKAALARRTNVEIERLETERDIETEVVAAVSAVNAARERVALADRAIAVAEENVRNERAQFENRASNNFEVMKRQSELAEAQSRRGHAISEYHIAVAQLQLNNGTLLANYRVNVLPQD